VAGETLDEVEIAGEDDLLAWLGSHHDRSASVWLVLWKKSVPDRYLDRKTLLRALLRYGWVDSLPRRKDDRRSLLLISPRKPGSAWSAINKRIVEFASEDLSFEHLWGAYGEAPDGGTREGDFDQSQAASAGDGGPNPESRSFGDIVHCVVRGPESTIYVCDRRNNRLQLFREAADGVDFVRTIAIAPETGGTRTASDVAFSPDGAYVYVADMMNGRVWILLRETHEVLGSFGRVGRYPGQFIWLHSVDVDSHGNVYTTEVSTGRRVQRFVFTGMAE